jgi:hypothetical protein
MGNRSFLYAMDRLPSIDGDPPGKATGLSDWAYDIPLSYRLLVSEQPRTCVLYDLCDDTDDEPLALAGEADGGYSRLCRFLDLLAATRESSGDAEFLSSCAEAKAYLASHRLGYYYLNTSEIDCLSARPYRASVERTLQEVVELAALVDQLSPSTIEQAIAPGGPLDGVLREHSVSHDTAPVLIQRGPFAGRYLPVLGLEWVEWDETSSFKKTNIKPEQHSAQTGAVQRPSRSFWRFWRR